MNGPACIVALSASARSLLPGHDFADAYQVDAAVSGLTARQATQAIVTHPPAWVKHLVKTRNCIVSLFQLRTVEIGVDQPLQPTIGGFPVVAQSAEEVVLGFDDKHLDFRISVTVNAGSDTGTLVTVATVVKTNNFFGRAYLATIMPFHRLIVRHLLEHARFGQVS